MFIPNLDNYKIILASQSPRRQYLLKELGIEFDIRLKQFVDENFPANLKKEKVPLYLAKKKADAFYELSENEIIITADTIVWFKDRVLNKPADKNDAINMLNQLSGNCHQVYTGVCIKSLHKVRQFSSCTDVYFKKLTFEEVNHYIERYRPFDKAGAYGIQEWIGYIGVEKINGSFFNVMGLPVQKLYIELNNFINS